MKTRTLRLLEQNYAIEGVSLDDPYFSSLSDGFDMDFARVVKLLLQRDFIAIDIGANIGITTCILSQRLNVGRVYSFEPSPSVFPVLERNVARNRLGNVEIHQKAVGSKQGSMGFAGESAYGHLVVSNEEASPAQQLTVDVLTIDDFVKSQNIDRVDFIKIDVEGFEGSVIQGATNTESEHQPLYYMEFNSFCVSSYAKVNPHDLASLILASFSYVFFVDRNGNFSGPISDPTTLIHQNIVNDGSVSNLLMTNSLKRLECCNINALEIQGKLLHATSERDHAISERDHARKNPWKHLKSAVKKLRNIRSG